MNQAIDIPIYGGYDRLRREESSSTVPAIQNDFWLYVINVDHTHNEREGIFTCLEKIHVTNQKEVVIHHHLITEEEEMGQNYNTLFCSGNILEEGDTYLEDYIHFINDPDRLLFFAIQERGTSFTVIGNIDKTLLQLYNCIQVTPGSSSNSINQAIYGAISYNGYLMVGRSSDPGILIMPVYRPLILNPDSFVTDLEGVAIKIREEA